MPRVEQAPRPTKDEHKYPALMQGPFPVQAVTNEPPPMAVFKPDKDPTARPSIGNAVKFVRGLSAYNRGEFQEHSLDIGNALGTVRQLLGVETNSQIRPAINAARANSRSESRMRARINKMFVEHFGIIGVKESTAAKIIEGDEGYARRADAFINRLRQEPGGILSTIAASTDLPEKVRETHDLFTLIDIVFSPNYALKVRRAAERKLLLMKIIGDIDLKKRHPGGDAQAYAKFNEFLDRHIWEGETIGATTPVDLISIHSPKDYSCLDIRILTSEEKAQREAAFRKSLKRRVGKKVLSENEEAAIESEVRRSFEQDDQGNYVRITEGFELRKFSYKGREISVNNSPRDEKDEDSTIIKVLRTGDAFMKDERGAMLVFNNYADIKAFIKRLYEAGAEGQVLINIHGVTNSLRGKKFEAEHSASSTETSLLKFHIAFLGINLEIVLVPRDKHMDNKYKFGPAHREYQTRRILVDEAAEKQKKDGLDAQEPRSVYHILFSDDAKKDAGELLEELIENSRTATKMGLS